MDMTAAAKPDSAHVCALEMDLITTISGPADVRNTRERFNCVIYSAGIHKPQASAQEQERTNSGNSIVQCSKRMLGSTANSSDSFVEQFCVEWRAIAMSSMAVKASNYWLLKELAPA
jgi:hypothetical protein